MNIAQQEKKERLHEIALLQFVGCAVVILGHSFPFVTEYPIWLYRLQEFLYIFNMPIFAFCSGLLLCYSDTTEHNSYGRFLLKRAKRLLLPYVVFSLIGLVPKLLLQPLLNDTLELNVYSIFECFFMPRKNIWGHFWFLPVIFLLGAGGYWLDKLCRKRRWLYVLLLIASAVLIFLPSTTDWMGLDDIRKLAFYYILGMSTFGCKTQLDKLSNRARVLICIASASVAVVLYYLRYRPSFSLTAQTALDLATACLIITGLLLLCMLIMNDKKMKSNSLLNRSYSMFILSWPCQLVVEIIFERLAKLPYYMIIPAMLLAGVLLPAVCIRLIDLIEKKRKRKPLTMLIGG